jgi:hypothetical protein
LFGGLALVLAGESDLWVRSYYPAFLALAAVDGCAFWISYFAADHPSNGSHRLESAQNFDSLRSNFLAQLSWPMRVYYSEREETNQPERLGCMIDGADGGLE